jgi:hypothetical protein
VYDELLRERYDDAEPRLADLAQLEAIAAAHATRGAFLAALALEPPASTQDLAPGAPPNADDDVLVLSTIHSAKGKEWDAVCVIGAADGAFPSARAAWRPDDLEEERRLLYVALTRARDELCVSWPLNSYASRWGADYAMGQMSRFLTPECRRSWSASRPRPTRCRGPTRQRRRRSRRGGSTSGRCYAPGSVGDGRRRLIARAGGYHPVTCSTPRGRARRSARPAAEAAVVRRKPAEVGP